MNDVMPLNLLVSKLQHRQTLSITFNLYFERVNILILKIIAVILRRQIIRFSQH